MTFQDVFGAITVIALIYVGYEIFNRIIFPKLIEKTTKEIEKNPKWIISKINTYGFNDIDFILVNSPLGMLPRFRWLKKEDRYELLLAKDTPANDVDDIIHVALLGKLKIKYGLFYPDKPLYWLSVLCYMLDGGDISMSSVKWEDKDVKKRQQTY